jgi:hypothetical protein
MTHFVTGLYKSPAAAGAGVRALRTNGLAPQDISVVASGDFDAGGIKQATHSKAPEGFAIGAAGGGALGAALAGVTAATSIATGGASLGLLVAGPIAAALVGGGAAATAGSIVGGMVGAAIPDRELEYYTAALKGGSALVGVKSDDAEMTETIKSILTESGAEKITHARNRLFKKLTENDAEAKLPM